MEAAVNNNWTATATDPAFNWAVSTAYANKGLNSYFADGLQTNSEKTLRLNPALTVTGQQPMLRFFHKYDTEGGYDAGVVEVSRVSGVWENVAAVTFRNPAVGRTYGTFPFADKTYWGNSNEFVASYVDLSSYIGRNISLRYRLKTDAGTNSVGWAIDDVLMMDAVNYNAGVRMIATSGLSYRDTVRTIATERGTIIEPEIRVSNKDVTTLDVRIFPNPTQNVVNVIFDTPSVSTAKATVLAMDGKVLLMQNLLSNTQVNLSNLAAGLYFMRVETDKGVVQQKIVKQ
jgi:extracellular elastinolytic metalloproteinase